MSVAVVGAACLLAGALAMLFALALCQAAGRADRMHEAACLADELRRERGLREMAQRDRAELERVVRRWGPVVDAAVRLHRAFRIHEMDEAGETIRLLRAVEDLLEEEHGEEADDHAAEAGQ
ncbi:MAG TPA: hypothetical protein VIL46_05110 [Gemmataceae bacterium]